MSSSLCNDFLEQFKKDITIENDSNTNEFLRPAKYSDIPTIKKLRNKETDFYFGPGVIIEELLEVTIGCRVLENTKKEIIAFCCFDITPNIPALHSSVADNWIQYFYNIKNRQTTHYIRYLVFDPNLNPSELKAFYNQMFLNHDTLSHIILLEPPIKQEDNENFFLYRNIIKYWGETVCSKRVPSNIPHCKLYVLKQEQFLAPLRFRIAIADDNDVLVELLDKKYPEMKMKAGEFHVAEQILKDDPNKTYILMENNEEVYGTMLINKEVDVDYLNKNFDLALCGHLKRAEQSQKANLMVVKDVVMRKTRDFFESNYFNLKPRVYESRRATKFEIGRFKREEESSEGSSIEDLKAMLISKSFEILDDSSENSVSNETLKNLWKPEEKELVDNNPNLIFREKDVLVPQGKSNAFMIEKFVSNIEERRIFELFKASFSLCTDKDYCITLVKSTKSFETLLNYFTCVPKRPYSECDLSLYIVHRNTVMRLVHLTEGKIEDIPDIERFLKIDSPTRCEDANKILNIFNQSVTSYRKDYHSVVVRSPNTIIGLIILENENRLHKLQKYFYLDSFYTHDYVANPLLHGRIIYLINLPLFNNTYRLIFSKLRKITAYKFFYYAIEDVEYLKIYNNLLARMCPVKPTEVYEIFDENLVSHRTYENDTNRFDHSYPLFYQSFKLSEIFFINVATKIFCIGFDEVCKGFLKKLIFDPKYLFYIFDNVIVLTQAGDFECQTTNVYDFVYKLLNWRTRNHPSCLRRLGLRVWVQFQSGVLIALDRKLKTVYLRDRTKLKYDYLILTCSVDFGFPGLTNWDHILAPSNYEVINSTMEAALFVHKITILKKAFPKGFDIVVYGNALQSFACVNYLLEKGIPGYNIHFVLIEESLEDELNKSGFRDKSNEDYILNIIENYYVNIYNGYRFVRWTLDEKSVMITSVTFSSKFKIITLKCQLFVCFNSKALKRGHRKVFQRSGLIIDGRLVIDENYKLNDPYIFAAGPITQYKRLLFAHKFDHYYYDQVEVGESLADKLCEEILNVKDKIPQIPHFQRPVFTQVFLPGGFLYITINLCGPKLPNFISKQFGKYFGNNVWYDQREISESKRNRRFLYDPDRQKWESDFFRVRYFDDGRLRTLICLTQCKNTSLDFLAELFTHNHKNLNLCVNHCDNNVFRTDPLKYFVHPWVNAVIYPRFDQLRHENMEDMCKAVFNDPHTKKIVEDYLEAKEKVTLSSDDVNAILNSVNNETTIRKLEYNLVEFIKDNSHHLFMYKRCNLDSPYFTDYLQNKK